MTDKMTMAEARDHLHAYYPLLGEIADDLEGARPQASPVPPVTVRKAGCAAF